MALSEDAGIGRVGHDVNVVLRVHEAESPDAKGDEHPPLDHLKIENEISLFRWANHFWGFDVWCGSPCPIEEACDVACSQSTCKHRPRFRTLACVALINSSLGSDKTLGTR